MPDADELHDAIDDENDTEMSEIRNKRLRPEDDGEDNKKKVRKDAHLTSRLKEGLTRAWQRSREIEATKVDTKMDESTAGPSNKAIA